MSNGDLPASVSGVEQLSAVGVVATVEGGGVSFEWRHRSGMTIPARISSRGFCAVAFPDFKYRLSARMVGPDTAEFLLNGKLFSLDTRSTVGKGDIEIPSDDPDELAGIPKHMRRAVT